MTIKFHLENFIESLKALPRDAEGFANRQQLIELIAKQYGCSQLAVHNYLLCHNSFFQSKHGLIKEGREPELNNVQEGDQKVFQEWLDNRNKVLDECVDFLRTQTPSPIIEGYLAQVATAREQVRSYVDDKLQYLLIVLKREYSYSTQTSLLEG
jgi:hypothetical protein